MTDVFTLFRTRSDGYIQPANNPNADSPDYYQYAQLRYDDFEDPNIIICSFVSGANSVITYTIPDNLLGWAFKLFVSRDNITFTEDKSFGGDDGKTFTVAEGINAWDFSNNTFPYSDGTNWQEKALSSFPDYANVASGSVPLSTGSAWTSGIVPVVANFSANQSPVRRGSAAWTAELKPREYFAYIYYNGTTTVLQNAAGNSGLDKYVINSIGSNPVSVTRDAMGVYRLTWTGSALTSAKLIKFIPQTITDAFETEIIGITGTNSGFNDVNSITIHIKDFDNNFFDYSGIVFPVNFFVYA